MHLPGKGAARPLSGVISALVVLALPVVGVPTASAAPGSSTSASTAYRNPVSRSFAHTYADPDVVRGADGWWYGYGTSDPLRSGGARHLMPMSKSRDLVHWQFAGDAFSALPAWADTTTPGHLASMWAPDVHYAGGQWRMYYVVTETRGTPTADAEVNDNAIGMATARSPLGPWTDSGGPVVGPRRVAKDNYLWTFDPEVVRDVDGTEHIFYGSYYGGIFSQRLDTSGKRVIGPETRIAIDNKFEGTYIIRRGGYWYFFGSTANCCAGPTTGYSVEVARSRSLTGPYADKEGLRIDVGGETGGTPVLYQNGNRWIGTGHNSMATDDAGRRWIVYHAIDRNNPFLNEPFGINRRPMLIDRIDWVRGWPVVRYGCGPSDSRQPGPVVRGLGTARVAIPRGDCPRDFTPGKLDRQNSDEFTGGSLQAGWQTVRTPHVTVSGGALRWPTEASDLTGKGGTASLLLRNAPAGNWTVQTKLTLDLGTDEVRNFQQAGLIVYANDDLFTRLSKVAIFDTRQIEFGKEMPYAGSTSYGGTILGPPASTTWLRITSRRNAAGERLLTGFSSRNGRHWTRGGTWTLPGDAAIRIGVESMGAGSAPDAPAPAVAEFDYFRVYRP